MTTRLNHWTVAPKVMQAMLALEKASRSHGLEHSLLELVKTRASQINRCAFCLDMHTRDARAAGETEERLYMLAALAWVEAPSRLVETGTPDARRWRRSSLSGERPISAPR